MPTKQWRIKLDSQHVIEVQHAVHSARVKILVDGIVVFHQDGPTALWDDGFAQEFELDAHCCCVKTDFSSHPPTQRLFIDENEIVGCP